MTKALLYTHAHRKCLDTETRRFVCRNSSELISRERSRNSGWSSTGVKNGTDHCHEGGDCRLFDLLEASDVRHDVVFCYPYGGASDTRVEI
jgi:hypothetical protein